MADDTFFQTVDDLGIVENHVKAAVGLEEGAAKKLIQSYQSVRQDLMEKLSRARGTSFTAQQLRGTLAQVDGALAAMQDVMQGEMKDSAVKAAMRGVSDLTKEISAFSKEFRGAVVPIRLNSVLIAQDTENFLVNKYETSIAAYTQDVRTAITTGLTNAMIEEAPLSEVHKRLDGYFQGETWKVDRLARTELHNVYNLGKLLGMQEVKADYVPDMMKTLYQPMDSRTGKDSSYAASLNLIVPLDEPFQYKWKGKLRSFMTPPDRPNDRSVLIPYRPEWGK